MCFFKINTAVMAARRAVPAKFSHMPVSPRGHRSIISITGNTNAVDTDMTAAGRGFPIASIKLWVAKEIHLVT